MKYAVAITAFRKDGTPSVMAVHSGGMVEASSQDEAIGFGYRAALAFYPPGEGWSDHHVNAWSEDTFYKPESGWEPWRPGPPA